jgi:serine/threonine protein kinase
MQTVCPAQLNISKKRLNNICSLYALNAELGKGGNARVFRCTRLSDRQEFALKVLEKISQEKKARFLEEIRTMTTWGQKVPGIMPVEGSSTVDFWYTMPVAAPIMAIFKNCRKDSRHKVRAAILGIRQVARTLANLHAQNISHRDIKPDNIYWHNGRFTIGDFGLVELPDSQEELTQSNRPIGATFTIAPEMKRYPKLADGRKADVYSLAKTLWMLLTGDGMGFEGKYDWRDEQHALANYGELKELHLVGIEELLQVATSNDPDARPSMREFDKALAEWARTEKSESLSQKREWEFLAKYMFGNQVPRTAVYDKVADIVPILNMLGKRHAYNYMFVPSSGGDDFSRVEFAEESECIYIRTNLSALILKPRKLWVETFPGDAWNYFLLETDKLVPIEGVEVASGYQELVEDRPGHYVSAEYAPYGRYDYDSGEPYPAGWRQVARYMGGQFLIVPKLGPYNHMGKTDDARHNDVSPEGFRKYIETLSAKFEKYLRAGCSPHQILGTDAFRENPFRPPSPPMVVVPSGKSAQDFFQAKYATLDFHDLIPVRSSGCRDGFDYCICFPQLLDPFASMFEPQRKLYLMANGRLEIHDGFPAKAFIMHCRDEILDILADVQNRLLDICVKNGVAQSPELSGRVEWVRREKPTHLFTRQELEELLRSGDDRQLNQLVVDGTGFLRLTNPSSQKCLYPVRFESFCPGNRYVGTYSSWSALQYDKYYQNALSAWLEHLQTGETVYLDLFQIYDEQSLISRILDFYDDDTMDIATKDVYGKLKASSGASTAGEM